MKSMSRATSAELTCSSIAPLLSSQESTKARDFEIQVPASRFSGVQNGFE